MKAALFDFDGVLGATMEDNFLAWQRALAEIGVPLPRREFFMTEGMKLREVALKFCADAGVTADPDAIVKKKEEFYLQHARFALYPGAEELLASLNARHIPIALVTAARRERLEATVPKGFLERFQAVITNERSGRGKPFPDPYLSAAEALDIPIGECVVIENAPLGIKAAKAAGARCIAISSTLSKDELGEADEVVPTIKDLRL